LAAKRISSLKIAEVAPGGIVWLGGQFWATLGKSNIILRQREVKAGKLATVEEITHAPWIGSEVLVPDKFKKIIYKIQMNLN
jgi:hypothetical protein